MFKVSGVIGLASFLLIQAEDYLAGLAFYRINEEYTGLVFASGIIAAGFVLNRKLKKDEWAIALGMLFTFLIPFILNVLVTLTLGGNL